MARRDITADDVIRELLKLSGQDRNVQRVRMTGNSSATGGAGPSAPPSPPGGGGGGGMPLVMTDEDDLIVGGVAGAPRRLGKGTSNQVLTVNPTTGHLYWANPATTIARYRFPLYTTLGGGDLLFDSDGHLMYVLENLE